MSASVSSPRHPAERAEDRAAGGRPWFTAAGAAAIVICLLPPVETLSQRYVVAESIQFTVFSMVAPALIVLGAPWRLLRLSRAAVPGGGAGQHPGLLDRLAAGRREQQSFLRAGLYLMTFMAVTLAWRLPPVMNALPHQPALVVAELLTLVAAGTGVWLELLQSPPLAPRLPRPHRAAVAALAMWFTWGVAYVIGFQNRTVFAAYASVGHRAISLVADQEIAVAIIWAVAGLCFVPLVISNMFSWLTGSVEDELQRIVRDGNQRAVVKGWGQPARGAGRAARGGRGSAG